MTTTHKQAVCIRPTRTWPYPRNARVHSEEDVALRGVPAALLQLQQAQVLDLVRAARLFRRPGLHHQAGRDGEVLEGRAPAGNDGGRALDLGACVKLLPDPGHPEVTHSRWCVTICSGCSPSSSAAAATGSITGNVMTISQV